MKRALYLLPVAAVLTLATVHDADALTKEELAASLNGVEADDITESPIPGVLQVAVGSNVAYITEDGRYLMDGELYDLNASKNLTEATRASARVSLLEHVDPKTMIVFAPEDGNVKHTITIFTDVDCGYCRQFHREIDKVNALGIEVHYLSYPRTGPNTESWTKAVKVWCAEDRKTALTRAKLGGAVAGEECDDAPIAMHYELGHEVGVRGTPAIFTSTGENIGGYLPPDELLQRLEEIDE